MTAHHLVIRSDTVCYSCYALLGFEGQHSLPRCFFVCCAAEWREKYGDDVSMFKWCREGLPEEVPQLQQVWPLVHCHACSTLLTT
jgi:hypothetical protein